MTQAYDSILHNFVMYIISEQNVIVIYCLIVFAEVDDFLEEMNNVQISGKL